MSALKERIEGWGATVVAYSKVAIQHVHRSPAQERAARLELQRQLLHDTRVKHAETLRALSTR